jgi:hypothetical protein
MDSLCGRIDTKHRHRRQKILFGHSFVPPLNIHYVKEITVSRVQLIDSSNTRADREAQLAQVHKAFGATPNMFRAVAKSPAAMCDGVLEAKLVEDHCIETRIWW